ncbi:DUF4160 domain-containing protein [Dyadobacter beijingensis]
MPEILEYFGMIFYFYSNEHLPIHIHVSYDEYESVSRSTLKMAP